LPNLNANRRKPKESDMDDDQVLRLEAMKMMTRFEADDAAMRAADKWAKWLIGGTLPPEAPPVAQEAPKGE
jgi:hypothetical protein